MKVQEFIDNPISVNKIMKHIYIPYEEKVLKCEAIAKNTLTVNEDGVQIYRVNTPGKNILFNMLLIDLYTDLDIDFTNGEYVKQFNLLEEHNKTEKIIAEIDQKEYERFNNILDWAVSDYKENNYGLVSWLDTKYEALKLGLGGITEAMDTLVSDKE